MITETAVESAVEWLEREFEKKWHRGGFVTEIELYGSYVKYYGVGAAHRGYDDEWLMATRSPGTMMELKENGEMS